MVSKLNPRTVFNAISLGVFYTVFIGLWIGHTLRLLKELRIESRLEHQFWGGFFVTDYLRLIVFTTLFFGILFWYLLKRREIAWLITVVLMGGIIVYNVFQDKNYVASFLASVELVVLLINARYFRVLNVAFRLERRLVAILISLFLYVILIDTGFRMFSSQLVGTVDVIDVLGGYWYGILDASNQMYLTHELMPITNSAWIFVQLVSFGGGFLILNFVISLLVGRDPDQYKIGWTTTVAQSDITKAMQDPDNLAMLKVSQNLELFELDDHRLYCLPFYDTMVVLGDPVFALNSTQASRERFVIEFSKYAHSEGKLPFFFQSSSQVQSTLSNAGFASVPMGQDALVPLKSFDLLLSPYKDVRYAFNKLARDGITISIISFNELDDKNEIAVTSFLRTIYNDTTGVKARFSLNYWPVDRGIPGYVCIAKYNDSIQALMTFLPYQTGLLLDILARSPEAKPGVMDGLMASTLMHFKEKNYQEVNLGVAFTSDEKNNRIVKRFVSLLPVKYSFSGITKFKQKFYPQWQSRYIAIPGMDTVPTVARALSRIFLGKD